VAIALALQNSTEDEIGEREEDLKALSVFFGMVASQPQRFPVTGRMASKITEAQRQAKGPAQKPKHLNARKIRQAARQGGAKRRRADRAEDVANFNRAQASYATDLAEMQEMQAEAQARAEVLLAQESLTPFELEELLAILGAPPEIQAAAARVQSVPEAPKILLP
jgi:hypothetical protein